MASTKSTRFVLISVGSRGDVEPFCALAQALLLESGKDGADEDHPKIVVDLFLQNDMMHLRPNAAGAKDKLTIHTLPFGTSDFYKHMGVQIDHENPRVKFVGIVAEVIGELVLPCFDQVNRVVAGADDDNITDSCIIIASSLARQLALAVASSMTKKNITCQVGLVQLQPLQPTSVFPHSSVTDKCIKAIQSLHSNASAASPTMMVSFSDEANLETYWEPERYQHQFLLDRLAKLYNDDPSAVPDFENHVKPILLGQIDNVFIINAFSNHLVPVVATEDNPNTWDVGPLADSYVDLSWTPPLELQEFLKDCPVCVGFGSMPVSQVASVLDALEELDRKAVVVGQSFVTFLQDNQGPWIERNIYAITSAPYPWLLPQCSMMLSHGGAGVVNSVLRAGIPHLIAPFMGDQFFFAKLIDVMSLGVACSSNLTTMTKEEVMEAVQKADDSVIRETSRQLGEKIIADGKTGVERLTELLLA